MRASVPSRLCLHTIGIALSLGASAAHAHCPTATVRVSADIPLAMSGAMALDHDVLRLEGGAQAFRDTFPGVTDRADLDALARRSDGRWLLSFDTALTLDATVYRSADVIEFNPTTMRYSLAFDSVAASIPAGVNLDALTVAADGTVSLSFDTPFGLAPLHFRPGDLTDVVNGQLASKRFDAQAAGLADGANIDAATILVTGLLVLSLDAPGTIGTVAYRDHDLISRSSGGNWQMYTRFSELDAGWEAADLDALDIVGVGDGVFCNGYE